MKILWFYNQWKIMLDLNMSHGNMSNFLPFPLFGFILVMKLRNVDFESHWNTSIFFDKKDMLPDLNMSHGKMSDFVSFPLFGIILVIKLWNSQFSKWLKFFDKKKILLQIWVCPMEKWMILFYFHYLGSL